MSNGMKKIWINMAKILLPIVLFIIVVREIKNMIVSTDIHLIYGYLQIIPIQSLFYIVIGGFMATLPMFFYDFYLAKHLKKDIPFVELGKYSFISNSISNLVGFGGLIGIALRNFFYKQYETDRKKLLKGIAVVTLFYLTGISILAWIAILYSKRLNLIDEHIWIFASIIVVGLIFPVLVVSYQKVKLHNFVFEREQILGLICVSLMEWIFLFSYLFLIAKLIALPVSVGDFFLLFLVAACTGIISMIPGGMGSFELIFLWGIESLGVESEQMLIVLFLYRVGYYLLPFLMAVFLLLMEVSKKIKKNATAILRGLTSE
ncbi:lysylphosphatidylglycerol synthase domain-containing protein [Niallia sp. Sow4_A1]|jgi:glycosyltransferase 2 family protein|uniref:lysylphosphatidylglycerol synthase domain-containing protein n=1 Tax=Bacillaceae TaxID=186817 RepID=UPI0004E232D5|nr:MULTISPECIES: lysylphosphatidylglycerol synthase domain-containing protein [unclassified Bacillus (in: firmicutes)]